MQHHLFYRLLIISCTFFLISCQQTIECYLIPSTDKASDFHKVQPQNSGTLFLAKNEAEHIQIVFKGCPGETYKIHRNENADNSIRYSCRQIKSVYGFDDALVPIDGEQVTLNDSIAKLWITFRTAESTRPGKYEEQISIDGNGKRQKIKIDLQVYDTALPSTPSLPAAFGIIEKNLIDSTSEEQTLQNKLEWAELCLDYRMNPYFSTWLANSMKHEASSSPWKWNDKRTVPFLSDKRFNRFAVPYHSLSHNELDSLLQRLKQTDLLDKSYFYLWDEPAYMKEYHLIGQYSQEIHKLMPEAKVLTTFYCGPKDGKYKDRLFSVFDLWRGDTQIFSMSAWALQANEANADTCRSLLRDNEEWWTYVCMGPGEEQPNLLLTMDGYQHRAVLWRSWKERTTGFLYWAVNAYAESDTLAFRKDLPEGDGVLIYPGQYFNSTSPVVSIRMERWRDSMEDYEYLAKLEKKIGRAKSETLFQSIYQSPEKYSKNKAEIEKFRKSILEILSK